jgi:hypothetical protein
MPRLKVLDWATSGSGAVNEDLFGSADRHAWIIDGASGLGARPRTPAPTDAAWLSQRLDRLLATTTGSPCSTGWVRQVQAGLDREFAWCRRRFATPSRQPAAAFAAVRAAPGGVDMLNIGDCAIFYQTSDGSVRRFGHSRVARYDQKVEAILHQALADGGSWMEALPAMRRQILANRRRANQAGGYWVVQPNADWARRTQRRRLAIPDGSAILLATDGLTRLIDCYGALPGPSALLAASRRGLQSLITILRDIEARDPHCTAHPRIKPVDDATGLLLEVVHAP